MRRAGVAHAIVLVLAMLPGCAAHRQDNVIERQADMVLGAWQAGAYEIMWTHLGPTLRQDVSKRRFIAMQELIDQATGRLKSYNVTIQTPAWKQGQRLFSPALQGEADAVIRKYDLQFERGIGQLLIGFQLRGSGIEMTRYDFWIPRLEEPAYQNRFREIQAMTD